jgi:hypothetical protein
MIAGIADDEIWLCSFELEKKRLLSGVQENMKERWAVLKTKDAHFLLTAEQRMRVLGSSSNFEKILVVSSSGNF